MKKLLTLLAAAVLICAAGCQKTQEAEIPSLPQSYSANISLSYGDSSMGALFTQSAPGTYGVDVIEPDILDPLSFSYENGEFEAVFDDITLSSEGSAIPQKDACSMLIEALTQVYSGTASESPVSNGIITYSGVIDGGQFTLTRNAGTGNWIEFKVNDSSVDILFSDFN